MRLGKRILLIGIVAVTLAFALARLAGPVSAVLVAVLAGVAAAALWQLWLNYQQRNADQRAIAARSASFALPVPAVDGGVTRFLRPEQEAVPFWPRPELALLTAWVASENHAAVHLVIGQGGAGKTRLARELDRAVRDIGFRAWWAHEGQASEASRAAMDSGMPALIVIDYAETCPDLPEALAEIFDRRDGPPVRALLLARSAGEWWELLKNSCGYRVSEALDAVEPVILGALPDPTGQAEVFRAALSGFASALGVECPDTQLPMMTQMRRSWSSTRLHCWKSFPESAATTSPICRTPVKTLWRACFAMSPATGGSPRRLGAWRLIRP